MRRGSFWTCDIITIWLIIRIASQEVGVDVIMDVYFIAEEWKRQANVFPPCTLRTPLPLHLISAPLLPTEFFLRFRCSLCHLSARHYDGFLCSAHSFHSFTHRSSHPTHHTSLTATSTMPMESRFKETFYQQLSLYAAHKERKGMLLMEHRVAEEVHRRPRMDRA